MAGFLEFLKIIFIPALISLIVYLSFSFVILPFIRRHRNRYDQYLPVHNLSDSLATHTNSLRDRIADTLTAIVLPSSRNQSVVDGSGRRASVESGEETFGASEGENMAGFGADVRDVERRREELRRDVEGLEGARGVAMMGDDRLRQQMWAERNFGPESP